jgi:threonyl-tRNA synthetase
MMLIFCTPDQATKQFLEVFRFILAVQLLDSRITSRRVLISRKISCNDDVWTSARNHQALKSGADYSFPRRCGILWTQADFMIKDALGRQWQCGTVRSILCYPTALDSNILILIIEQTPVMVHRAPLGS